MPEVVSDIVVSPATVWYAPEGEAAPDPDSISAGTAWGGNWTQVGYTNAPLSMLYEFDELEMMIEQSLAAVGRVKTSEALTLETTLAELYLDGVLLGTEGTVTDTAVGASQVGREDLTVGGEADLTVRTWGFEGTYIDEDGATFPIRLFIHRATARLNGALEFGKAQQVGVPLQVKALADMAESQGERLFVLQKVLEPGT
jgi:hypothetical protein